MEVNKLKKQNILQKSKDYNRIIKKRQGINSKYFILNKEQNNENITKFGITFTKNIGNAVTRNKLKRRVKSIIDNNKNIYQNNTTYVIIIKKISLELKYCELEKELVNLFLKIKGENYEKNK